jgi:hypothetical protein
MTTDKHIDAPAHTPGRLHIRVWDRLSGEQNVMTKLDSERIETKRARVVAKIKEVAPHIDYLAGVLDETKLDLLLISLAGETLPASPAQEG